MRPAARRSYYRQTPQASKMAMLQHRYQRAQRRKMAAGLSGTLPCSQIKSSGITKQPSQTSKSPDQNSGIQRSMNRLHAQNETTQATVRQQTPRGTARADSRSSVSKPRGDTGKAHREKVWLLPAIVIG
ncbi:Hypothetical predicted protein [Pelobates cultripes]|uniref:Uncharacterized protein n=1 Tax=Pelobates cultripes TaxID=61616 RepID=A0AAD1VTW9_PELCU|nr:Hypothetical predicted protein [Pelobates cultripes]